MMGLLILRLKIFITFLRNKSKFEFAQPKEKNIFLFLGADYGNLGDVAITYAQMNFLKVRFFQYNTIEIPISRTYSGIKAVKRVIKEEDIIVLIGGGNTSDLYDDIEFLRQLVVWNFRKQKIVAFPQTFDFTESKRGHLCKLVSRFVYGKAKNLTIMAREQNTMNLLQKDFPKINAVLMPDIVMTLDMRSNTGRKGVLICMRSDREKAVSINIKQQLITKLKQKYSKVDFQDTQVDEVTEDNRYERLNDVIRKFQSHELVITDRLHGMILCYITGTPVLAFDNSNHKISACFDWIKDCGYVQLIQSLDDIDTFKPIDNFEVSHNSIIEKYDRIPCLQFH